MSASGTKATVTNSSYRAVTFGDLPGWSSDDHLAAFNAFARSCHKITTKASRTATSHNSSSSALDASPLTAVCEIALGLARADGSTKLNAKAAREFFETYFIPNRVEHDGPKSILTGYYEPEIEGSRNATAKFSTPIYRRPADLVNLVSEADRAGVGNKLTHARKTATGLVPYPTRARIEQGLLAGQGLELVYLADPVEAFFLHIQGSGIIRLPDGSAIRITYDGKNGRPYSSIGTYLIRTGVMGAKNMSLGALGTWLRANPERGRKVMWHNKSYIFFRELKGAEAAGAHGVMNIQLTPGRSLAIDPRYHDLGLPIYVSASELRHVEKGKGFHRLMVGQDVGSAIKGPERGDLFFGSGTKAGELAGVTKATGTFYVLLPRSGWQAEVQVGPNSGGAARGSARETGN